MKRSNIFSEEDFRRVEGAIHTAERETAGEIIVLVQPASDDYHWVTWLWAAIGAGIASTVVTVLSLSAHWPLPYLRLLEWQLVGIAAGAMAARFPALRRLALPAGLTARKVHREALANFIGAGLHETRDRTGVLIFLSELEHRVEILADRGIHEKVGADYWKVQVDAIVRGIHEERAGEAVAAAVLEVGKRLAGHFPRRPDDRNELSNTVLRGPQGDK